MHRTRVTAATLLALTIPGASAGGASADSLDRFVECQRSIELVYWNHREWPAGNTTDKPELPPGWDDAGLRDRAVERLQMVRAAESHWRHRLDDEALRRELQRMAKRTREPALLMELWAALDHDPRKIAECLVRPHVARRIVQRSFETDGRFGAAPGTTAFDEWWKGQRDVLAPASPHFDAPVGALGDGLPALESAGCEIDTWSPVRYYPENVGTGSELVSTGTEVLALAARGGDVYDPATDRWHPMSLDGAPQFGNEAAAVWTGSEAIVYGGTVDQSFGGNGSQRTDAAGRYDPIADSWNPVATAGAPSPRGMHSAVWTGSEMIVWGGVNETAYLNDGARYDPATDTWTPMSTVGAPDVRARHLAVWTGDRMLVWGGHVGLTWLADGGSYDPVTDTWSPISTVDGPEPRSYPVGVWSGSEFLIWGGCIDAVCSTPEVPGSGFRYDPLLDTWTAMSTVGSPVNRRHHTGIWSGGELLVWGGCKDHDCSLHLKEGAGYDPALDTWRAIPDLNSPSIRSKHLGVWTGTEMMIWAGCDRGECNASAENGGRYDPVADAWTPVTPDRGGSGYTSVWTGTEMILYGNNGRRAVRYDAALDDWTLTSDPFGLYATKSGATAVWSGTDVIFWGGSQTGLGPTSEGALYDPVTDSWRSTGGVPPVARFNHLALWTGSSMLVWGGCSVGGCSFTSDEGALYDPIADSWTPMTTVGAPAGRVRSAAVWTGGEMIVWGGTGAGGSILGDGAVYDLAADTWQPIAASGAPSPRESTSFSWTGTELLVWGGWQENVQIFGDGARYRPADDTWSPIAASGAPAARTRTMFSWTGSEMLVWGGCFDLNCYIPDAPGTGVFDKVYGDGALYDPALDSWRPLPDAKRPRPRYGGQAAWTGSEVLIVGGQHPKAGYFSVDDGGRFCATSTAASLPGVCDGLAVARSGADLDLSWNPSCSADAVDYAVYEGDLGDYSSHAPNLCSTGGSTAATVTPGTGSRYFLIVPLDAGQEGSYGVASSGSERPASTAACMPAQSVASCP